MVIEGISLAVEQENWGMLLHSPTLLLKMSDLSHPINSLNEALMKCEICGVSINDEPLYRNAPIGVTPAHWRCLAHTEAEYLPEPDVMELAEIISADNRS